MRVCVLRLDSLGDTLLSTPAIAQLRDAGCQVTVVTHPAGTPVLRGLADTLEVTPQTSAAEIAERLTNLQAQAVLVFSEKRRALTAALRSKIPVRIGFDPGLSQPLKSLWLKLTLTGRVPFSNQPDQDPGIHEVIRYQKQVQELFPQLPSVAHGLHFELLEGERAQAAAWMEQHQLDRPLALQLTPKWSLHDCTPQILQKFIRMLPQPLIGFYGPAEKIWAEEYFGESPLQLCFQPDLRRYGALLADCRALVTVDTGAAHLAAALGTPVVDVFPELHHLHCVRRWTPWRVPHRIVLSRPGQHEQLFREIQIGIDELCREFGWSAAPRKS